MGAGVIPNIRRPFTATGFASTSDAGTPASGLVLGASGDTNLYRAAANVLATDDALAVGISAAAAVIVNSDTIITNNVSIARVAPGGAVTGIILQAGVKDGQTVSVVNEAAAANTVTFAAAGTSVVADGASTVIPGLRGASFRWSADTFRWYRQQAN